MLQFRGKIANLMLVYAHKALIRALGDVTPP